MKYFFKQEDFIQDIQSIYEELGYSINEKNFFNWLIKSRKFGDLLSLKKVVKLSKKVAELRFTIDKRKMEIKKEKTKKGENPNLLTEQEMIELKSYADEAINIEKQIEHTYGQSEYLMYVSDLIKLEEENKFILQLRKLATTTDDKKYFQDIANVNDQQQDLIQKQVALAHQYAGSFDQIDNHTKQKEKEKRDELLAKLQMQKAKMQNDEAKARTDYLKNQVYNPSQGQQQQTYTPKNTPKQNTNTQQTQTTQDDEEVL